MLTTRPCLPHPISIMNGPMTESIWGPHLVYHKEKVLFKKKKGSYIEPSFNIYSMPEKFNFFVFSLGRKEEGGTGFMFDNEDEKEQWEEDQKVSTKLSLFHALYISIFFSVI